MCVAAPGFHDDKEPEPGTMWRYHHTRQRARKTKMKGTSLGGPLSILTEEPGCGDGVKASHRIDCMKMRLRVNDVGFIADRALRQPPLTGPA